MNEITPSIFQASISHDCCQSKASHSSFQHIEEGVDIIEEILKKNVLCRHDVERINHVYRAIDRLERKIEKLPKRNSQDALKIIIEKIQIIACSKNISASNLISLYQLKFFSGENLPVEGYFNNVLKKFSQDPEGCKSLASFLPSCHSEIQFNEDVTVLIGNNSNQDVSNILQQKREKIKNKEHLEQVIKDKKLQLENYRKVLPQNYPPYFDELLDKGYVYLFDHLIFMRTFSDRNTRKSEIEKMTFSLLSHVILETRSAIIQKVESSIPHQHKNILFLLGETGVGKTTILCFLKEDKMVLKDFCYESQSDTKGLIGHDSVSCTFLPTVEIINDWAIVDFPGFEDTSGQAIALGMEFALKALIKRYNPKVFVLESITNTEGRYVSAARLGLRLKRILDNREDCVLGITKYAQDPHFGQIKQIEEQQMIQEESILLADIKTLSELNIESLQELIEEKKRQLAKIVEEKSQKSTQPLPETPLKLEAKKKLAEKEEELSKKIGLKKVIAFKNLEVSPKIYLENLISEKDIHINPQQELEPDDKQLLSIRFKENLIKELEAQIGLPKNILNFEQSILESSLISTIFSLSNPEIGQFLHLPEMDPAIVRSYDKEIVGSSIKKYMECVIQTLDISLIKIILQGLEKVAPQEKILELQNKLKKVQDYIMGLLGETYENIKQAEEKWNSIRNNHQTVINNIEEDYKLPTWLKVLMGIPLGVPYGIHKLLKWNAKVKVQLKVALELIQECGRDLDQVCETLSRLKDIENLIEKQEAINRAFSMPISTHSIYELHNSLLDRINKVRFNYGAENWDYRVSFLANQFVLIPFDSKDLVHVSCMLAFAYIFLEPGLAYDITSQACTFGSGSFKFQIGKGFKNSCVTMHTLWDMDQSMRRKNGTLCLENGKISINSNFHTMPELANYPYFTFDREEISFQNLADEKRSVARALTAAALLKANGNMVKKFFNQKEFFSYFNYDEHIKIYLNKEKDL